VKITKRTLFEWIAITAGTLLVTAGIYFFKFPNNLTTGGVSGISVVLGALFPGLSASGYVLVINIALLLVGFLVLGRSFGMRTCWCSLLMSFSLVALERFFPMSAPLTDQPTLELMWSVLLPGVGSAILFNLGASTGGTDIIAMILKRLTSLDIGGALFCTDFLIVLAACFVFDIETGLLSLLGLLAKALVVDNFIESINAHKYFIIVTERSDEICAYINRTLKRGATVWNSEGAFTHSPNRMVLVVMKRSEARALRTFVKACDPNAFILISNTSDIIGKGFREASH